MGRLTERCGNTYVPNENANYEPINCMDKLGRLEDLEEAGRLIELPCAVGDEYWCTERDDGGEGPVIHKVHSEPFACLVKDLWGIKCFATKEEAERKRRELNTHERE